MASPAATSGRGRSCLALGVLAIVLVVVLVVVATVIADRLDKPLPITLSSQCVARAGDYSSSVDLEQAHYAAIIASVAVKRGLPPRAATIALATAFQESQIRNIDYGDRDSVGLFQQRPSSGWGTVEQIMDPYYSSGKFYDALIKVKNWRTRDITEVAQAVQRSAYPDAYRQHEGAARALASVLTGQTPAGLVCVNSDKTSKATGLRTSLRRSFGSKLTVTVREDGTSLRLKAKDSDVLWAATHYAIAQTGAYGTSRAVVGDGLLDMSSVSVMPRWSAATANATSSTIVVG